MSSITPNSIFRQQNPYENIIQELLQVDGQKKRDLQSQEATLKTKKSAISDIGSKMTALNSLLTNFTDPLAHTLDPLAGTSSNTDAISVLSTDGMKHTGSYNISVSQLAKNDIALSDSLTSDGSTLSSSGSASFSIGVNGKSAAISVDTADKTNHEVMDAIAKEVNNQLGDELQASVFNLGNGEAQLSFKSAQSGEQSRIAISDVQGDAAGLNLHNVFAEEGSLNAKFTIDSVSFQRSSNKVDDAVEGLSFKLNEVTSEPANITVSNDTKSVKKTIQSFIDKFNDVNSLIRKDTYLNGKTGDQGPLQDERAIRNLSFSLRQDASLPVKSLEGQSIQSLSDIGIELKQDGTMYIDDSDALDKALQASPENVKQLFTADDGLAHKLQDTVDQAVTGESNMFDTIKNGIDRKVDRLDDHIASQNDYLDSEEKKLRQKYAALQQIKTQGQYQLNRLSIFRSSFGM
jgi:flagellar hook-associated protein 2